MQHKQNHETLTHGNTNAKEHHRTKLNKTTMDCNNNRVIQHKNATQNKKKLAHSTRDQNSGKTGIGKNTTVGNNTSENKIREQNKHEHNTREHNKSRTKGITAQKNIR